MAAVVVLVVSNSQRQRRLEQEQQQWQLEEQAVRFGPGAPATHLLLFLPEPREQAEAREQERVVAALDHVEQVLTALVVAHAANRTSSTTRGTSTSTADEAESAQTQQRKLQLQLVIIPPPSQRTRLPYGCVFNESETVKRERLIFTYRMIARV